MNQPLSLDAPLALASVQLQRNTFAELQEAKSPWREGVLEGFRRRNAWLDALFYDVGVVKPEEAAQLAPWLAREGALLIVPPTGAGSLQLCSDADDFDRRGGPDVRILSVAGVGSSALGSAAFARNVADAFDEPVATVVSGYGLSDLVTEALGGWFWFGQLNQWRHHFEQLDDPWRADLNKASLATSQAVSKRLAGKSLDTRTVSALLLDKRFSFSLLTGHSKGNLVLSEALYGLGDAAAPAVSDSMQIVTVSAIVAMPARFGKPIDVMGQVDWFGRLNSRQTLQAEVQPDMAWHHTNTQLPFHLPVQKVFEDLRSSDVLGI